MWIIPWNTYLVADRIILRAMSHGLDTVSMQSVNLQHHSIILLQFTPWNSNLLHWYIGAHWSITIPFIPYNTYLIADPIISRAMPHEVGTISMLTVNVYTCSIIPSSHGNLYPETHTCLLWVEITVIWNVIREFVTEKLIQLWWNRSHMPEDISVSCQNATLFGWFQRGKHRMLPCATCNLTV